MPTTGFIVTSVNKTMPSITDFATHTFTFMTGALVVVCALAWNNAFTQWFEDTPSLKVYGPWVYALFVTGIAYVVSSFGKTIIGDTPKQVPPIPPRTNNGDE